MPKKSKSKNFLTTNVDRWYKVTLLLLVILGIIAAMAFRLIDRQRNEIDSLRFRLDLLYSKLNISSSATPSSQVTE